MWSKIQKPVANQDEAILCKVRKIQIQQLYGQTWGGLAGVLIVTFSVCILLWHVIPQWKLIFWTTVLVLITVTRGFLIGAFQQKSPSEPDTTQWANLHVIGVAASGLMWGLAPFLLWPDNSAVHQLIWPTCIVGLAASAVSKYFTWSPSYITFLILSAGPLSLRLLLEGSFVYIVLGLLGLVFIAILSQTGRTMHTASLQALIVGIRNEELTSILSEEKLRQEELNAQLRQEIIERISSQEELRLRNQELEQLNARLTTTKNNLESANKELERALTNVKQLSGMLPICASCKKIRNDTGYWEQIEAYLWEHSEIEFSHSICPDCSKKLYPDY